jgi:uncharacterized membrane protein
LCRSRLGRSENLLIGLGSALLVLLCWGFTHLFSGRGTFLEMGALIGTIMVANVFLVIIPKQKQIVAALLAGRQPDEALGQAGKQRSVHNNYLTLPVVFLMISNHYPLTFATRYSWVIFAVVLALGFVIRHFFNRRHAGKPSPWWAWIVVAVGLGVIGWLSWAGARVSLAEGAAVSSTPSVAEVEDIVLSRCSMCHAAEPVWAGIGVAPRGVMLDTPNRIRQHARQIQIYAVLSDAMPPGNITEITTAERRTLALGLPLLASER